MAKLPPIDIHAHWIREMLHRGQRTEALARIQKLMETGKAGHETRALAEFLARAGKGRQPFGAKHLWPDIGADNDAMRARGMSYEDRLSELSRIYRINDHAKIKTAIATYESAMAEIQAEEHERGER